MNTCIFGDSIIEGYYDDEEKNGWVNRLKSIFSDDEIYNLGISGDSTENLLNRFDGLHPNAVGHEWMANKIARELK
ncbi:MAG: SGNH/GDSL hydrolase family protein [Candidatus Moranbacteria bacterium]|jgi:lysophospholipase L1-like esterase|nr:SGNH/GDSL hydrolase family protein [Candidatus Moranbacteria bacterium]